LTEAEAVIHGAPGPEPASQLVYCQPYADEELAEKGLDSAGFAEAQHYSLSERPVAKAGSL
jgi:hypothetical protein